MNEPIKDKAPKPPGLLPKNVQSWVIIGIALLMVVIMWLTGGRKPQATGKSAAPTVLTPEPDSGSTEAAACCAECPRAANPLARVFAAGTVAGATKCWS